jgi:hypothetical protein
VLHVHQPAATSAGERDQNRSAALPATVVFLVCGVWLLGVFGSGHDVRDFIHMGRRYVAVPHVQPLFKLDPHYHYLVQTDGYDGQFAYYIALAPVDARTHLDRVNYRYTRILYPMLARALSLGQAPLIPYMLILIDWLALAGGTFVVGLWLRRRGVSPWLALAYGLSPGLFICLHRDLEEPLAYGLVALGMYLFSYGGARRLAWSGVAFALAALTRESTALFPAVIALCLFFDQRVPQLSLLSRTRWSTPARFLGLALGPFLAYKVFLLIWLSPSTPTFPPGLYPEMVPLGGLFTHWLWDTRLLEIVAAIVVPAMLCAGLGVWAVLKRKASPEVWLLLANIQLFVVMLNPLSYMTIIASARITTGVLLAALLCIPTFDRLTGGNRIWLWLAVALWFLPYPTLLPLNERPLLVIDPLIVLGGVFLLWSTVELRSLRLSTGVRR